MLPSQPTQNLQMMRVEPGEEDLNVNIVLRRGIAMGDNKGKQPENNAWVHKAPGKEDEFHLECAHDMFMEEKKNFIEASTSGSQDKPIQEMDPSILATFLETYMKLLRDRKAVKGLQELINRCAGTTLGELLVAQKIGKHKTRTGGEMRLTAQIREYEMDQVILDLGSDVKVLPKKTWEWMGILVSDSVKDGISAEDHPHGMTARSN